MVESESELKSMWEGLSGMDRQMISDHIWSSDCGGDFADYNYEKAIEHLSGSQINVFKNIVIAAHKGCATDGHIYVENKDTGKIEHAFYPE